MAPRGRMLNAMPLRGRSVSALTTRSVTFVLATGAMMVAARSPAAQSQTPDSALSPSPAPSLLGSVAIDPEQPIRARVGQTFAIALRSNRTTGFSWQLASPPGEAIRTVGSAYEERSSLIGGGGQEIWLFTALTAGSESVTLRYVRPFDKGSAQMERALTFRIDITP